MERVSPQATRESTRDGNAEMRREPHDGDLIRLDALGSGSDYTPFLQHTGVAALNIGYGGEGGGSYHSVYDSFDHYIRFGDPTFDYGIAQAKTTGRLVLRLANADGVGEGLQLERQHEFFARLIPHPEFVRFVVDGTEDSSALESERRSHLPAE